MPAIFDGTNGLTFNDNTRMGSANSLGMRNALFNADFRINQRGYTSGAVLAAGAYGHDRFKAGASGGDYSFTQLNSSTQVTIASGKSLIQVVEDKNVVGGSYVLSWTGTALARVGVNSATPSGTFVVSPILITGQTAGTTMSVEFNAGTLNTAQLELGTVATPFERRPVGLELALCQRYFLFIKSNGVNNRGAGIGVITTSTAAQIMIFTVPMRATPTITYSAGAQIFDGSQVPAITSVTAIELIGSAVMANFEASGGGLVVGRAALFRFNATSDFIALSSEL